MLFFGFYLPVHSQTVSVTQLGTIGISTSEYINNMNKTWDITIATTKKLQLDYSVSTESCCDKISVYSVDNSGNSTLHSTLSGQQTGSIISLFPNGKMKIVFKTDGSVCGSKSNTGFQITISEHQPALFGDGIFSGNVGIGASPQATDKLFLNNTTNISTDIYGLRVNMSNTDGVGKIYGIHSKVSGKNGDAFAGYFEGAAQSCSEEKKSHTFLSVRKQGSRSRQI
jgi:hypothetical protein